MENMIHLDGTQLKQEKLTGSRKPAGTNAARSECIRGQGAASSRCPSFARMVYFYQPQSAFLRYRGGIAYAPHRHAPH
jgi:hypothetical protein